MNLKSRQTLILILLNVFLLSACNDRNTQSQDSNGQNVTKGQIQDSLNSIVQVVFKNSEQLNLEMALTPFLTTNDFFFISNGQRLTFQTLKKSESEYFSGLKKQSFNFTYKNFDIINQDNAIVNLVGTLIAIPKDGHNQKYNIAETIIFKRVNSGWKIVGGHESYVSDSTKQ